MVRRSLSFSPLAEEVFLVFGQETTTVVAMDLESIGVGRTDEFGQRSAAFEFERHDGSAFGPA